MLIREVMMSNFEVAMVIFVLTIVIGLVYGFETLKQQIDELAENVDWIMKRMGHDPEFELESKVDEAVAKYQKTEDSKDAKKK